MKEIMITRSNATRTRKGIAVLLAAVFTVTTVIWDPSAALAAVDSLKSLEETRFRKELRAYLYAMPAEIGTVTNVYGAAGTEYGASGRDRKFRTVIHIQDAHANPDAQRGIHEILKFLEKKYPGLSVAVEGAAGPLHPELLDLFREYPEANEAVIDDLLNKGELSGAELFAWENYQNDVRKPEHEVRSNRDAELRAPNSVPVFGAEDTALYAANLKTYRELLFRRDDIANALRPARERIEKEASRILSPDLRKFLKERARRKEGNYGFAGASADPNLQAYTGYLRKTVLRSLAIDLDDPFEQLRFPNLVRILRLGQDAGTFDAEAAAKDWRQLIADLRDVTGSRAAAELADAFTSFGAEKGMIKADPSADRRGYGMAAALYPRALLERLFNLARDSKLDLDGREAFFKSYAVIALQAEIDITELMDEMERLEERLTEKLARSAGELALVKRMSDLDLLAKLLSLEMRRDEYRKALEARDRLEAFAEGDANLQAAIAKALLFYEGAILRDQVIVENALGASQVTRRMPQVVVLITGGFHTDGIREAVTRKGIDYAEVLPRIMKTDKGEMYRKVMSDDNADLSAYFKVKNPFLTKQEAILFKETLEVAAPVLFDKNGLRGAGLAGVVKKAFEDNPVLSRATVIEKLEDTVALRFTPRASVPVTAAVSAIPHVPNTAAPGFAAIVAADARTGSGTVPAVVSFTGVPGAAVSSGQTRPEARTRTVVSMPRSEMRAGLSAGSGERWTARGKVSRSLTVGGRIVFLPEDMREFQWLIGKDGADTATGEYEGWIKQVHDGLTTLFEPELTRHLKAYINMKIARIQRAVAMPKHMPGMEVSHPIALLLAELQDGIAKGEIPRLKGKDDEKKIFLDYLSDTARFRRLTALIRSRTTEPKAALALFDRQFEAAQQVIRRSLAEQEELLHGNKNRLKFMESRVIELVRARQDLEDEMQKADPNTGLIDLLGASIADSAQILGETKNETTQKAVFTKQEDLVAARDRIESYIHILQNELLPKVSESQKDSYRAAMEKGEPLAALLYPQVLSNLERFRKFNAPGKSPGFAQSFFDISMLVRDVVVDQLEVLETELLKGTGVPDEVSKPSLADGKTKGLLVRRNASAGEILRALDLFGKELGFIVASRASQNAHWVQIVRGLNSAPPILFLSETQDKANLDKLSGGEEALLKCDEQTGEGELIITPARDDLWEARLLQEQERLLREGERRLAEYPLDIKVGINMSTTGDPGNPSLSGAVNSSLIRTDFLAEKTKQHIGEVASAIASGDFDVPGWIALLQGLEVGKIRSQDDVTRLVGGFMKVLKGNGMPSIRGLLGNLRTVYGPYIRHPFFAGNYEPFRTLDLQNDSKNKDLLELLFAMHAKDPGAGLIRVPAGRDIASKSKKWITGFNFYRNSSLGRFFLIWQITALLIEYSHYLNEENRPDPAKLAPLFPMVSSPSDLDFIKTEILPFARKLAVLNLRTDEPWTPESLRRADQQVEKASRYVSYGMMLEMMPILEDPGLMDAMIQRPDVDFYDVGTNDLEKELWEDEIRNILREEGLEDFEISREAEEAQHIFGKLHPRLMTGLDNFVKKLAAYNAAHPGHPKRMCICGQMGGSVKFLLLVERWRRMGVPISVSVGFEEVRQVRHAFLRYRQIPAETLDWVASEPAMIDSRAETISSRIMAQSRDFLKVTEEFQNRYAALGYYHGFYQDSMDPVNGIGSFRDVRTAKKLIRVFAKQDDLEALDLDESDNILDDELERILGLMAVKNPFLPDTASSFMDEKTKGGFRDAAQFLRNVRDLFEELYPAMASAGRDPRRKEMLLHSENLSGFIDAFEKSYPRETRKWLSRAGAAKRQEEFFNRYYGAANIVYTQVTGMMHEGFESLFGATTEGLDLVTTIGAETRDEGALQADKPEAGSGISLKIWKRLGMVFKRELGFIYREVKELYVPAADEKNAFDFFTRHPDAMVTVFKHASSDRRSREIRISFPLNRLLRQVISVVDPVKIDGTRMGGALREFFSLKRDISYPVWRLHRFGFLQKFFPLYGVMRNYFPGDGRHSPVHIQTLNSMEFLERLWEPADFAFARVGNVFRKVRDDGDKLMMIRLTLLMIGIVRAKLKLKTGEVPNVGEIEAILRESLREKIRFGMTDDQIRTMAWLIYQERHLNGNELITSREILSALQRLFYKTGEQVTEDQLDMLYLLTFAMRAGRVDHDKLVMLKRQGPDSALANCDKLYVAGQKVLRNRLPEEALETLVQETKEVVNRGWVGSDRPVSLLYEDNPAKAPSIRDAIRVAWESFKERSPAIFESYRLSLELNADEAGVLRKMIQEMARDSSQFMALFRRYDNMVSTYYREALDSETLVAQLIFCVHLQHLQNTEDSGPIPLFIPLVHHYNNAFEILIGRALEEPGLIALYSRILYENGFVIESTTIHREAAMAGKYVVRFMGSFPRGTADLNKVTGKIIRDFNTIFSVPGKSRYAANLGVWETWVRRFHFYVRPFIAWALHFRDREKMVLFFRNAHALYKDFTVRRPRLIGQAAPTEVFFLSQPGDKDFSRLVIRSQDRRGLIAFVTTYLSQIRGLDVVDFYFDDTMGRNPRMIVDLSYPHRKGVLTEKDMSGIVGDLKRSLDADSVEIHRYGFKSEIATPDVVAQDLVPPAKAVERSPVGKTVLPTAEVAPGIAVKEKTGPVASAGEDPSRIRRYTIVTPLGLHLMPATLLSKKIRGLIQNNQIKESVIKTPEGVANPGNIMEIVGLGAGEGTEVSIEIVPSPEATEAEIAGFWNFLENEWRDARDLNDMSEDHRIPILKRQEVRQNARSESRTFVTTLPAADLPARPIVRPVSASSAQAGTLSDRGRMVNLLKHVLNSKLIVLYGASTASLNSEFLLNTVRETLALLRIFDPETFRDRGGRVFVPEGADGIFAHRINSLRSPEKVYETPVFGDLPAAGHLDALEQFVNERWFREMQKLFLEDVATLESLKKELSVKKSLSELEKLRGRIVDAAESIHGHLEIVSGDKSGVIPAEVQKPGQAAMPVDAETLPKSQAFHPVKSILVADDDDFILALLVKMLKTLKNEEGQGYIVEQAADGVEALDKLRSGKFDLVITDVAMPRMDGKELAQKILEDGRGEHVLFVTGYGPKAVDLENLREKGLRANLLLKPYGKDELEGAIASFSKRSESRQETIPEEGAVHRLPGEPRGGPFSGLRPTRDLGEGIRKAFNRGEMREIVKSWMEMPEKRGTPGAAAVREAARRIGSYSQKHLTVATEAPRKAHLWIALNILEEAEDREGRVENRNLRDAVTKVLDSARNLGIVADSGRAGPEFHVNMSWVNEAGVLENPGEKDWDALVRNFPVVVALLISLRARLSINVTADGVALGVIQKKFESLLAREGLSLGEGQLRIQSTTPEVPFRSFAPTGKADALFARNEAPVRNYNGRVRARWVSGDEGRMETLAAGLATALLYAASDKLDGEEQKRRIHRPSDYGAILEILIDAIAGYAAIGRSA